MEYRDETEVQRPLSHTYSGSVKYEQNGLGSYDANIHPGSSSQLDTVSTSDNEEPEQVSMMRKYKEASQCRLIVLLLVVSIIAIVLSLVAIIMYSEAARELRYARENQGKTCLPCNMGGMPTSDSWDRDKDGKCCMKVEDILGIVDKIAAAKAEEKVNAATQAMEAKFSSLSDPSSPPSKRVSAHLSIDYSRTKSSGGLRWTESGEDGHLGDGLELQTNGGVKVLKAGYYYVYSKIQYYEQLGSHDDDIASMKHEILIESDNHSRVILKDSNMIWKGLSPRGYTIQTSNVFGTVYVRANTILYASFDPVSKVSNQASDSYFGLFRT